MSKKTWTLILPLAAAMVVVGSGFVLQEWFAGRELEAELAPTSTEVIAGTSGETPFVTLEAARALNDAFVDLVDQVMPGVVRIEVRREGTNASAMPQFQLPEPLRRFFEMPDLGSPQREPVPQLGGGTGFLVSSDGYIVTNSHVVGDAEEITVWLSDQRSYEAALIGRDPTTDVAVVRIQGNDLPALTWGSSDALRVGEWVMAIGNPGFAGSGPLDYTATTGIISAKDRPLQLIGQSLARDPAFGQELAGYAIENFIQTDAVINPGNSGGPMVNLFGEVVGINTAIASTTGYYQGYGFAVPADLARRVVEDLIDDGRVQRAWLGVTITAITSEDADVYGLPGVYGALVQDVTEGGPAEDARLRPEDVIVAVDGEPVYRSGGLQQQIAERRPGEAVTLSIYRDGKPIEVDLELGEAPIHDVEPSTAGRSSGAASLDRLGIEVRNLTPELAERLGYEEAEGVVITDLERLGPAARRGVARGMRIREIGGKRMSSTRDVERTLAEIDEGAVATLVLEAPSGQRRVVNVRTR